MNFTLNRIQRLVIGAMGIALLVLLLYPPIKALSFRYNDKSPYQPERPVGHHYYFARPHNSALDRGRLGGIAAIILASGLVLLWVFKDRNKIEE